MTDVNTSSRLSFAERRDWLRLSRSENVGSRTFSDLMARYGNASDALAALPELSAKGGLRRTIQVYSLERAESDIERAEEFGAHFVAWCEADYPALLHHIDNAPPMVCIKGNPDVLKRPTLAIVGARNASALGCKLARGLAGALGEAGFCVVSGMARGIDTAAHEGSLGHGTVAVMAGGIDNIYPPENEDLYHAITRDGLVLCEHVVGTRPREKHFPRRNRLVSGMSLGVLVVEAAMRSGSLITARLALEQNREVFAVPGNPLDPRAEGTNSLIKNGATLVRTADDVIEVISPIVGTVREDARREFDEPAIGNARPGRDAVSQTQRSRILDLLGTAAISIDDIIRESGLETGAVMTALLELELAGMVQRLPSQKVVRAQH